MTRQAFPVVELLAGSLWAARAELSRNRLSPEARELLRQHAEALAARLRRERQRRERAA